MENTELARDLLFWIILFVILLVVVIYFIPYIFALSEQAQKKITPPTEEPKEEVVEKSNSLGILTTDLPEIKVFKLFRNFDPMFLNETGINKIKYNSFILNLSGKSYDYNDVFINNLTQGLRNFSLHNNFYQIGTDAQQIPSGPNCLVVPQWIITYNNDCWDAWIDSAPDPCIVYLHGDGTNRFNEKVKIRVVWYKNFGTSPSTGREVIKTVVTVCDG